MIQMTLMGTGTSHGVPVAACRCPVCRSKDRHDKRMRCSAYITEKISGRTTARVLIDAGPEFRLQALRYRIPTLNAVLITHSHADHLHGLDDLRVFSHTKTCSNSRHHEWSSADQTFSEDDNPGLPLYADASTLQDIHSRFAYVFKHTQEGGGKPKLYLQDCGSFTPDAPLTVGTMTIVPIPLLHGKIADTGWVISCTARDGTRHSIAYLTDCSFISEESLALLARAAGTASSASEGTAPHAVLDHLIIDALRPEGHTTHCSFEQALGYAERIQARCTWFTHISHDMTHTGIQEYIQDKLPVYPALTRIVSQGGCVSPAHDGLRLTAG